jgi:FkbM family methyltransferase
VKDLYRIIRFISRHPLSSRNKLLAYKRLFAWQIAQAMLKRPVLYSYVEDSILLIEKGMTGATGNIYTGLLDFEDMSFVLHSLRKGDTFADVGANVGVYTILASRNAGARVLSVEPNPSTVKKLRRNVDLNEMRENVVILPYVAGSGDGTASVRFTQNMDTINHVIRDDEKIHPKDSVEVAVKTLDELFAGREPAIMKIDVEGFEWPALAGAKNILASDKLKALIIELNSSGTSYGHSDEEIHQMLLSYQFSPYAYNPFSRTLAPVLKYGNLNTIYIKDPDWVNQRIQTARKFRVLGQDV